MGSKRKRNTSEHLSNETSRTRKKQSTVEAASAHPHGDIEEDREYQARAIIDEKRGCYLIDWADDPETGTSYDPTWEPKRNANQLLINDWQKVKALKPSTPTPKKRGRARKRRVVESSPITSRFKSSTPKDQHEETRPQPEIRDGGPEPEIPESQPLTVSGAEQDADSPLFVTDDDSVASVEHTNLRQATIQLSAPPSSWQRGSYQRFVPTPASPIAESIRTSAEVLFKSAAEVPAQSEARSTPTSAEITVNLAPEAPAQSEAQSQEQSANALSSGHILPDSQDSQPKQSTFRGFSSCSTQRGAQFELASVAPPPVAQSSPVLEQATVSRAVEGAYNVTNPTEDQSVPTVRTKPRETSRQTCDISKEKSLQAQTADSANSIQEQVSSQAEDTFAPDTSEPNSAEENQTGQGQEIRSSLSVVQPTSEAIVRENCQHDSSISNIVKQSQTDQQDSRQGSTRPEGNRNLVSGLGAESYSKRDPASQPEPCGGANTIVTVDTPSQWTDQFLSQSKSDYRAPPAAQHPLRSSNLHRSIDHEPAELTRQSQVISSVSLPSSAATLSSAPFLSQVPFSVRPTTEVHKQASPSQVKSSTLDYLQLNDSSPSFPSIPSYSLPSVGESAPPLLETPSIKRSQTPIRSPRPFSSMSASKTGSESLSAKLKAMRERNAARRSQTPAKPIEQPASSLPPNIAAEIAIARALPTPLYLQDGTRSPSAVPAMEPEVPISKEEMNTSERYETLLPQAQAISSDIQGRSHNGSPTPAKPREPNEDPELANVHAVPVSLANHQGDQYRSNIYYHQEVINQFLSDRDPSLELQADAEQVVKRLRQIAIHPDLVNIETLSQVSDPEMQKQWDVDCSGKFRFLNEFLGQIQNLNRHVAVITSVDQVPAMLETFLRSSHIPYTRDGSRPVQASSGFQPKTQVSIIDVNAIAEDAVVGADIVIALDGSIDTRHPIIRKARRRIQTEAMSQTNSWAMLLVLVAPQTIEHVERYIATNLSPKVKARVLLNITMRNMINAGRLDNGQSPPKEAASALADFLDDPDATEWPLAGLGQIENLDSQTDTEIDHSLNDLSLANIGDKRPLDSIGTISPNNVTKRPRLDDASGMPTTINPQDLEVSHISDSLGKGTQTIINLAADGATTTELELRVVLDQVQDRMEGYISALEDLQFRHEAQRTELVTRTRERDGLIARMQKAAERMTLTETNNSALKTERIDLKTQLEAANAALVNHTVPERQELELSRLATAQATADKSKAEKRAEQLSKDLDWTRSMYQDSSNKARELAEANTNLEKQLAAARVLASGEQGRAKQLSNDARHAALERENVKLKAMLRDREAGMKFKDEEIARLKESGRGRMGTRQSSVPRSPRLGSPMKVVGGRGSRQASPTRAGHLHPLRNG